MNTVTNFPHGKTDIEFDAPGAEGTKVLGRLGDNVGTEFHNDSADVGSANCNIKENLWVGHYMDYMIEDTLLKGDCAVALGCVALRCCWVDLELLEVAN